MRRYRLIQGISLFLFLCSLAAASGYPGFLIPPDTFLRLDPVILIGSGLAGRAVFSLAWILLLLLAATAVIGRFFCSHLCPLGITIDFVDRLFSRIRKKYKDPGVKATRIKYLVLVFILASSILGVSFVFLVSPMALATRFYTTAVIPGARLITSEIWNLLRPLLTGFNNPWIDYSIIATPRFTMVWTTAAIMVLIFSASIFSPRFWCRYLCPSGAVFALFSVHPLLKRKVENNCTSCGICQKKCPMNAIGSLFHETNFKECITCLTCQAVCPESAISFSRSSEKSEIVFSKPRRDILAAGVSGIGVSLLTMTNASEFYGISKQIISPAGILRPPGSFPENEFLARCVQCGACMAACPTNALHPSGLKAGFTGLFSPALIPEIGPCQPHCTRCGDVCPTQALQSLSETEKVWSKIGTARIRKERCLVWEQEKQCLICDEVCPFDAIEFKPAPGHPAPVPIVNENKCWGCGFCENQCPVRPGRAIIVEPAGAIRISGGSFEKAAKEQGLRLSIQPPSLYPQGYDNTYPQSISPEFNQGLPPGFTQ